MELLFDGIVLRMYDANSKQIMVNSKRIGLLQNQKWLTLLELLHHTSYHVANMLIHHLSVLLGRLGSCLFW